MCTTTIDRGAQRLRALKQANEVRAARSALKQAIAAGERSAAEIILNPPAEAKGWPIRELIQSQRGWGRPRVLRLLFRGQVPELKPVGKLTDRQRRVLAGLLGHQGTAAGEGERHA